MAKVTIVISDDAEKGSPVAVGDFKVDYEGAPEGTPPTMAVLFGATIQRLWRSKSLAPMVPLICSDLMALRRRGPVPLAEAPAEEAEAPAGGEAQAPAA